MEIKTGVGMIDESKLVKKEIVEPAPCGSSVTTQYFLDGKLVRQDVTMRVVHGVACAGQTGLRAAFRRIVEAGRQAAREFNGKRTETS